MLITADDFKLYISLNTSNYDDVIEVLISGAVRWIEAIANNKIKEDDVVEYFDGYEIDDDIFLENSLNIKTLVVQRETDGSWIDIPDSKYTLYPSEGIIKLDQVIGGERNYKISYKAGFATVDLPKDLKLAILRMVGALWNKRKSDGIKMENLGDAGVTWESYLSQDILAILSKYKKFNI